MAPTVTFLRHAESIGNVMARKFGQTGLDMKQLADCGLTAEGFAQCAGLRERLAATDFDVIYCSPTLLYGVIGAKEAPVIVDWRLAEGRGWAEFNELTPATEVDWPAAWDIIAAADQREEKETVADVNMRTTQWWLDASDRGDSNARILVVTHANPIQIWAAAWPEVDDLHLGNAEIHIFEDAAY